MRKILKIGWLLSAVLLCRGWACLAEAPHPENIPEIFTGESSSATVTSDSPTSPSPQPQKLQVAGGGVSNMPILLAWEPVNSPTPPTYRISSCVGMFCENFSTLFEYTPGKTPPQECEKGLKSLCYLDKRTLPEFGGISGEVTYRMTIVDEFGNEGQHPLDDVVFYVTKGPDGAYFKECRVNDSDPFRPLLQCSWHFDEAFWPGIEEVSVSYCDNLCPLGENWSEKEATLAVIPVGENEFSIPISPHLFYGPKCHIISINWSYQKISTFLCMKNIPLPPKCTQNCVYCEYDTIFLRQAKREPVYYPYCDVRNAKTDESCALQDPRSFGPVQVDPIRCGGTVNIFMANGEYIGGKNTFSICRMNVPLTEVLDVPNATICYDYADLGLGFKCDTKLEGGSTLVTCSWGDRGETDGEAAIWACNQVQEQCADPAKWSEIMRFEVKPQNLEVLLPKQQLQNGCYRFAYIPLQNSEAILGDNPNSNPSYPYYRADLGDMQQCLPLLHEQSCGEGDCLRCQIKSTGISRQATSAEMGAATCTVYNQTTGMSCVVQRQNMEDGSQLLLLSPTLCGEMVTLSVANLPTGYAKTDEGEFPCKRSVSYRNLTGDTELAECEIASGREAGDANGDKIVDIKDVGVLKMEFGKIPDKADFNSDGVVDLKDLAILKRYFGLQTK